MVDKSIPQEADQGDHVALIHLPRPRQHQVLTPPSPPCARKDFRLMNDDSPCTCGVPLLGHCLNLAVLWAPTELEETSPGSLTWVATMPAPTGGQWTAFFIDLQFDGEAR